MSAVNFRVVAPRKTKQFNYKKVWYTHPTDCMVWIPELYPDFQWDDAKLDFVVVNNQIMRMLVFKKGTDYYILENNYIELQRTVAQ